MVFLVFTAFAKAIFYCFNCQGLLENTYSLICYLKGCAST